MQRKKEIETVRSIEFRRKMIRERRSEKERQEE